MLPGMDLPKAAGTAWDTAAEALDELHRNPAVRQGEAVLSWGDDNWVLVMC